MYIKRTIEETILEASKSFRCVAIYGPRQCGKTTTVTHLFGDEIRKVTLDDADDRKLANENPRLFLETYGWPLIIDEVQKAPGLFDYIKINVDEYNQKALKEDKPRELMYILTGSSQFELEQGISDSLAGRCAIINMSTFSQAEKYGYPGTLFDPEISTLLERERNLKAEYRTKREVFEQIYIGGMPDLYTGSADRESYLRSYVSTYIEKDVRKLVSASNEMQFRRFISLIALRTAQTVVFSDIAKDLGINVETCKRWISILQTSGIIYLLQPYMANASKRIIKSPKLYFMDTGLCAYLCKWPNAEMLMDCAMSGAFFETYAVSEIIKSFYNSGIEPQQFVYFYRDIDKKEVDILLVKNGAIYPVEIKKNIAPVKPTKNFKVLEKYNMPVMRGMVLDNTDKIRAINDNAFAFPISLLGI